MDILNPTEEEIDLAAATFSLGPITVADIKNQTAREKVETFRRYYVACFHPLQHALEAPKQSVTHARTFAVVFPTGLLSFTFLPALHGHRTRELNRPSDSASLDSEWICCALLYGLESREILALNMLTYFRENIINEAHVVVDSIGAELDAIEGHIHIDSPDDVSTIPAQVYAWRERATGLERFLAVKAVLVKTLQRHRNKHRSSTSFDKTGSYLDYIYSHISSLMSNLTEAERSLYLLHSTYLAKRSMNISRMGSRIAFIAFLIVLFNIIFAVAIYHRPWKE